MARLRLTVDNYFSPEANWQYMSASQYKAFRACEAAALAELRGEWSRDATMALRVGGYLDAYFSKELAQFEAAHPDIFKRDGTLKAEFQAARSAAERLERDDLARMLLGGRAQVIKTGKIGGVWFKGKFDSLLTAAQVEAICKKFPAVRELVPFGGAMIVDLKYMRDFAPQWSDALHERVSFVEYWGYDVQGAIYQALDKRHAPFVIVGVTKEATPNVEALYVPDDALADCLAEVTASAPRYAAIKRGEIPAVGCGECAYCRSVKRLDGIKHYKTI